MIRLVDLTGPRPHNGRFLASLLERYEPEPVTLDLAGIVLVDRAFFEALRGRVQAVVNTEAHDGQSLKLAREVLFGRGGEQAITGGKRTLGAVHEDFGGVPAGRQGRKRSLSRGLAKTGGPKPKTGAVSVKAGTSEAKRWLAAAERNRQYERTGR